MQQTRHLHHENYFLHQSLRRYVLLHSNASQTNVTKDLMYGTSKHRYLYLELSASGLGNRLNTLLSGFLTALLYDRILLISAPEFDINDLLCQPFEGADWIWPRELPWDVLTSINHDTLSIAGADFEKQEEFAENDFKNTIVRIREGEMYFVPLLFSNPTKRPMLDRFFPSRNVAHVLSTHLIHPR